MALRSAEISSMPTLHSYFSMAPWLVYSKVCLLFAFAKCLGLWSEILIKLQNVFSSLYDACSQLIKVQLNAARHDTSISNLFKPLNLMKWRRVSGDLSRVQCL